MACKGPFCKRTGEGVKVGWTLEARQGSRVEVVVVWDKEVAMGMQRR